MRTKARFPTEAEWTAVNHDATERIIMAVVEGVPITSDGYVLLTKHDAFIPLPSYHHPDQPPGGAWGFIGGKPVFVED